MIGLWVEPLLWFSVYYHKEVVYGRGNWHPGPLSELVILHSLERQSPVRQRCLTGAFITGWLITYRHKALSPTMIKDQEVAKVNMYTQLADTQQKECKKERGARIN